jgi:C1A family cysteine protease
MYARCPRIVAPLVLAAALITVSLAAPRAWAAGPRLEAAPFSAEFLRYQADLKVSRSLGWDRLPGFRLGLVPTPMDPPASGDARLDAARGVYPASYDLRTADKVSPVKDQRQWGTCWTFATLASLESCLLPGELRDLSEDNLALNAGFDTGSTPAQKYDHGGNYSMSTAYLIRWDGPVDESEDAYGDSTTPPGLAANEHVQEVLYVPGGTSATDTANIKYALTTYGAVATSIDWQSAYYSTGTAGFYDDGDGPTNHAVTIVGWDDGYAVSNFTSAPPGPGAWLVKNSWGTGWGRSGYFWASYYDQHCARSDVFNAVFEGAQATNTYSDVYSYDPLGQTGSVGVGSTTTWGANVFTARRSGSVAAAGFFTPVPDTSYTVYAGASLGSLQARGSGSISMPGYHTVAFSSPMAVSGGDTYVVAMSLTAPGDKRPIAVECAVPGYSSTAAASPGQSFISGSGSSWIDITTWDSTANVCLKAYTTSATPTPTPAPTPTSTPAPTPATADDDTVGPRCAAKNVTVKRGRTCKLYLKVCDALSARVTKRLVIQTRSGKIRMRWSTGYRRNDTSWRYVKYRCRLPRGKYRIVVTGKDLAGNKASVVGKATLRVR